MKKFGMAAVLIGLGLVTALAQTGGRPIVYGSGGQPVLLDPGNVTDGNSIIVLRQIYDYLVDFKDGTTEPTPGLALRWSPNADSTVWTFTLRPGVRFHDGTPLNAEAVKFNLDRWWDDKNAFAFRQQRPNSIFPDFFGGFRSDSKNTLFKSVEATGPMTVRITLTAPLADFPLMIGSGYFGIASPTAIRKAGANYGTAAGGAVGTGPFMFKSWRTGDRIELDRNPNYWRQGLPKASGVVVRFITEPAARLAELRAGNIDFTVDLPPDTLPTIRSDNRIQPVFRPSFNVGYLALNPSKKELSNVKVRQAIASAINKKDIVNAFWGDLGLTNGHFLPPSMDWAYSKKVTDYTYNPEAAKKMLADAGYPNGFSMDLWYMPVSRPYFPTPKPIAEALAADLAAVGIKANLQTKDWGAYLADRRKAPGFDSFMLGWTGDFGSPDNFLYTHFGPGAVDDIGGVKLDRAVQLMEQGQKVGSQSERSTIYQQVDEILFDQALRIPIVHSRPLLAKKAGLTGWTPSPLGSESFANLELK